MKYLHRFFTKLSWPQDVVTDWPARTSFFIFSIPTESYAKFKLSCTSFLPLINSGDFILLLLPFCKIKYSNFPVAIFIVFSATADYCSIFFRKISNKYIPDVEEISIQDIELNEMFSYYLFFIYFCHVPLIVIHQHYP